MENLKFCDSCGLPIVEGKLGYGTLEDGSSSSFIFCFWGFWGQVLNREF